MTIRENGLSHIPFHTAAEPTSAPSGHLLPREGGRIHTIPRTIAFHAWGRGERSEPDRVPGKRERTTVSSLRFTRVPERRSHPLSSLPVEGCPCGADLSSAFGAPLLQGAAPRSCKSAVYENTASPLLRTILPRVGKMASIASRIGF